MKKIWITLFSLSLATPAVVAQTDRRLSQVLLRPSAFPASNPLIVVDDNVYDTLHVSSDSTTIRKLDAINIDDIESVSVLKNQDAISRYGEKAKNGVVIIETKQGKFKKVKTEKE